MCDYIPSDCTLELTDPYHFDYFINNHWDWYEDRDPIVAYGEYKDRLDKKLNKINYSGYSFITLSPDWKCRNIEYTEENIKKFIQFCKAQFTENNYSYYNWVVESGKHNGVDKQGRDRRHLHAHALVRIRNSKHHKRDLMTMWNKFFKPLVGDDYHVVKCNTKEMFIQKNEYLINDRKDSHENFEDLATKYGAMGASESISAKQ
jgi:hypothetical protein